MHRLNMQVLIHSLLMLQNVDECYPSHLNLIVIHHKFLDNVLKSLLKLLHYIALQYAKLLIELINPLLFHRLNDVFLVQIQRQFFYHYLLVQFEVLF